MKLSCGISLPSNFWATRKVEKHYKSTWTPALTSLANMSSTLFSIPYFPHPFKRFFYNFFWCLEKNEISWTLEQNSAEFYANLAVMNTPLFIQSRELSDTELFWIQGLISKNPSWSRYKISREICRHWEWKNAKGQMKDIACRSLLRKLDELGYTELLTFWGNFLRPFHATILWLSSKLRAPAYACAKDAKT